MALTPYASVGDLREWLGLASDADIPNATQRLRSATVRVAAACDLSPYDSPADNAVQPLKDATCAQAAAWMAIGLNPDAAGLDAPPIKRVSLLDATVDQETSGQADRIDSAANEICAEARSILFVAGLLWLPGEFEIADGGGCFAEATEIPTGYVLGYW